MTVSAQTPVSNHTSNGLSTAYAYQFKLFDAADLLVTVGGVQRTLGTHYTVTGVDNDSGGTVVFATAPALGQAITLKRQVSIRRLTDYQYAGDFKAALVNKDFDRLVMMIQDSGLGLANAIRLPSGDGANGQLPSAAARALKAVVFDAAGNVAVGSSSDASSLATALASAAVPAAGAGLVGYDSTLPYSAGTLGAGLAFAEMVTVAAVASASGAAASASSAQLATATLQAGLADVVDAGAGTSLVGYLLNATGAVGRTLRDKLHEVISVKDFGAAGNGTADDTQALQYAVNFCAANGLELFLPQGTYKYTALTVAGGLTMRGCGKYKTFLRCSTLDGTHISIDTAAACCFTGITFAHTATPTGGQAMKVTATPDGVNQNTIIRDCSFDGLVDCVRFERAMTWTIDNCTFSQYTGEAVHVQNDHNGDGGDHTILNSVFAGSGAVNSVAVYQVSSGGLRLINNKIVAGAYGYLMNLAHGVQTGDLLITGNSIENLAVSGIQLNRITGGTQDMNFSNVTIVANQFLGTATGVPIRLNDPDANWLQGVTIVGNQIDCSHAGNPASAILVTAVSSFIISGNQILGGGSTVGINIGAAAVAGYVGGNSISGIATGISNSSPSTNVQKKVLNGTATLTCSTALGSLFSGTQALSFPTNFFGQSPRVTASVSGGTNGVSAGVTGAPTTTGTTLFATAAATGASVVVTWRAEADY